MTNQVEQELAKQAKTTADLAVNEMQRMVRVAHPMVRLAGLSGAAAVILGAYGAHGTCYDTFPHISLFTQLL